MEVNEAIEKVGGFGLFQIQLCALSLFKDIVVAFNMIGLVFIAMYPEHVDCRKREIAPGPYFTIVNEWNLVCEKRYLVDLAQSFFMAGVLVGAFCFGPLSDIYGRRKILFLTFLLQNVVAAISAFARSYPLFVALRCIVGFFTQGVSLSSFTLLMEMVSSPYRASVGIFVQVCFALGIMLLGLFAYAFAVWRHLTLALALTGFALVPFFRRVPESPRWLVSRGRVNEAETILRKIALHNGKSPTLELERRSHEGGEKAARQEGLINIFQHPILRIWTLVNLLSWLVNSAVYYGLTFIAGKSGASPHLSVAISGLMEVPSYLFAPCLMGRLGRKRTLIGFMFLAGICCTGIVALPKDSFMWTMSLATLGKLFISGSFAIAYVHTMEIYPTSVRTAALGLASMFARIGGILAPFILMLGGSGNHTPFVLFAVLALGSGCLNFALPETSKLPMAQVVADVRAEEDTVLVAEKDPHR